MFSRISLSVSNVKDSVNLLEITYIYFSTFYLIIFIAKSTPIFLMIYEYPRLSWPELWPGMAESGFVAKLHL